MTTKRIFSINGSSINNLFTSLFSGIRKSRFVASSKSGSSILNLPLVFVIILAILFPVTIIIAVIASIVFHINIAIEKESTEESKLISNQ